MKSRLKKKCDKRLPQQKNNATMLAIIFCVPLLSHFKKREMLGSLIDKGLPSIVVAEAGLEHATSRL